MAGTVIGARGPRCTPKRPTALPAHRVAALPGRQEVRAMPGLIRREPRGEAADVFGRFDRLFEE